MQHYNNGMLAGPTATVTRPAEHTSGGIELDTDNSDIAELHEQVTHDKLGKYGKLTLTQRILSMLWNFLKSETYTLHCRYWRKCAGRGARYWRKCAGRGTSYPCSQKYHLATAEVQVHLLQSLQSSAFHKVYKLDTQLLILAVVRYLSEEIFAI